MLRFLKIVWLPIPWPFCCVPWPVVVLGEIIPQSLQKVYSSGKGAMRQGQDEGGLLLACSNTRFVGGVLWARIYSGMSPFACPLMTRILRELTYTVYVVPRVRIVHYARCLL
jgi:hypothetical protein